VVYWLRNEETEPDQLVQSEAEYAPDIFQKRGSTSYFLSAI
tara:strand:+ start:347 stop:469 length:123 start_codon:yes stop_codon:yes gene_type:complete